MNDLAEACRQGNAERFKQLLSEAENYTRYLDKQDRRGRRLIHYAAEGGSKEIVSIILDKGGAKQAAAETYTERDIPMNIALQSGKPSAVEISSLLLDKMKELEVTPRKNSHYNRPLHYACKVGNLELIRALADAFPDTVFSKNRKGSTPLSFAIWEGNVEAAKFLLARAPSPEPSRTFSDFTTLFRSYDIEEKQLDIPIDVFVVGENQSGKSSVVKSVQAESGAEKFWGLTYNTTNVDVHKIGLIPTDFPSKSSGRILFHDLASGPKYLNVQLVNTPDEVERSLFFVVVDCRPEKKDMERKLEFWLSVVHKQCAIACARDSSTATPTSSTPTPSFPTFPNVVILGSFGDYVKAFRNTNEIRLDHVIRSVTKKNSELVSSLNILEKVALDCRKAQSVPMGRVRAALKTHYRRRRQSADALDHHCYILSSIFAEMATNDQTPVISLEDLSREISEKPSNEALSLHSLLPSDIPKLLEICRMLEDRKKIFLVRTDTSYDEDIMIAYDMQKLACMIDVALLELKPLPDQPPNPKVALIEQDKLQEYLSEELSVRPDVIIPVLDALKIHGLSVQEEMETLSFDRPHYFIPSLLPETNPDLEEWSENASICCFAWTYRPVANQLYSHFLPTFTNSLLLVLFDLCASMDSVAFDSRTLWQGGLSFKQEGEIEVVVVIASTAITLNLRCKAAYEIICLHLRNKLLEKIQLLKKTFLPEVRVQESIIPKDGARFPVSSPTPSKNQIPIPELKEHITKGSLSVSGSILSLAHSQSTQISAGSIDQSQPFFEHCFYLPRLNTIYRQYLMLREHADTELTDSFLYELRRILGDHYEKIEQYFNLPPISITPAASLHGFRPSSEAFEAPPDPGEGPRIRHVRTSSLNFRCNTFGNLVQCLDSISIFKTAEFLAESQRAEISGGSSIMQPSSSVSIPSLPGHSPLPPVNTKRLFPCTTRTTDGYPNVYFVDLLQVFTCDSDGGVFHSPQHGVTVKIPSGAIPNSSPPITFEFGIALNGPFEFPPDVKPISPFVWLCTDTPGFVFQKLVEVTVPHFISLHQSDCEKLAFMKANHREADDEYVFRECSEKMKFKARSNHGVLLTAHTCFLCIAWKLPENVITRANFCLMKVMPKFPDHNFNIFFCFTFFLETCMETVQRQFNNEEYDIQRSLVTMDKSSPEPQLIIDFDQELPHKWKATKEGGENMIMASEVEFLHQDIGQLHLMNNYRMYPPRFSIHISGAEATKNSIMEVRFQGLKRPISYQIQLKLPPPQPLRKIDSGNSIPPVSSFGSMASPAHSSPHVLDRIIVELERYLDVDTARLRIRQSGILTNEDMKELLDVSLKNYPQSVKVERMVDVIKKKGEPGLRAFISSLEATTDGTGHQSILDILLPLVQSQSL